MSEELITIEAEVRTQTGKEYARKLRQNGKIPANLIEKSKSTSIELDPKWLGKVYKTGKKFNLSLGGQTKAAIVQEIQIHATKRVPLHVDVMYL